MICSMRPAKRPSWQRNYALGLNTAAMLIMLMIVYDVSVIHKYTNAWDIWFVRGMRLWFFVFLWVSLCAYTYAMCMHVHVCVCVLVCLLCALGFICPFNFLKNK